MLNATDVRKLQADMTSHMQKYKLRGCFTPLQKKEDLINNQV